MWPEVEAVKSENRRELKLAGAQATERIVKNGGNLDDAIYQLSVLNLLEVSDTALEKISPRVEALNHLQSLLLYRNKIAQLPATIGRLGELKVLDLSGNRLTDLPIEFANLHSLTTLNLSFNRLKTVDLSALDKLSVCNLSGNELTEVPLFHVGQMHHLTEVNLEKNSIVVLPDELTQQHILRVLNVAENKIEQVPKYITKCAKLKEINLKGNPLKDKRLLKLVDQCRTKQVLDYVEKNGYTPPKVTAKKGPSCAETPSTVENPSNGSQEPQSAQDEDDVQLKIIVQKATANTPKLTFTPEARANRPHIVLCIVRNFPVTSMKTFLQLQNALHDNECGRREIATIATHDLAKVKGSVRYHAAPPGQIEITALGSAAQGKVTAEKYYTDLCHQAEQLRKEKKRNTYSGVHKYITLLTAKELFAFLSDEEKVISLPPLTNCDETKISPTSTDMLLEVTSSVGHGHCVRVMNALLEGMLLMDVEVVGGTPPMTPGKVTAHGEKKKKSKASKETEPAKVRYNRSATLTVEQVQQYDSDGKLHSVFPGKGDLSGNEMARISVEMA